MIKRLSIIIKYLFQFAQILIIIELPKIKGIAIKLFLILEQSPAMHVV